MELLAQVAPESFWKHPNGSSALYTWILIGLVVGIGLTFGLSKLPTQARRPVVVAVTFLSGLFYVLLYLWPNPVAKEDGTLPRDFVEKVGFWLQDAQPSIGNFSNILTAFLLGLGIFSVLRIHARKVAKSEKDWPFSVVLLGFMTLMVIFGYWDWANRKSPTGGMLDAQSNWAWQNYTRDFLFDGLFQQMNAAMFSIIAFFILSAAYRAFRIRSIEATILLAAALIMMLSLMGTVASFWDGAAANVSQNLTLSEISKWLRDNVQNSSLRGIDFGIGIGALAMGLRLGLSLEKTWPGS
ncbi:MAG: hypothetical protein IT203_08525 [Fimbriimonadaceae bacterium]|nr:hypothetical protein [Fimbriimonadaceae bacterium]